MTVLIVLGFAFPVLATVALATPGAGLLNGGPVHARGTIAEELIVNSKSGVHLKTKGPIGLATQQLRIRAEAAIPAGTATRVPCS